MIKMKKVLRKGREELFEKNIERFVFMSIFLFLISVVVYSAAPNPGHLTTEIDGFGIDADLQVTLDGLQQEVISCAEGKAITRVNIDGTVTCGDVDTIWAPPSSITARGSSKGNMGGYDGMASHCDTGEHVCGSFEITRREQIYGDVGTMIGGSGDYGRTNTGIHHKDGNKAYYDCKGWTSSSSTHWNTMWEDYNDYWLWTPRDACNVPISVLCCS